MSVFAYADSWAQLVAQPTPRSYGVLLSALDPWGLKVSVQIAFRNTEQATWDSPSNTQGWDESAWDDGDFAIWVDVTDRVRGFSWGGGVDDPLSQPQVATATVTLANLDGEVSPWARTGPFTNPVGSAPIWDSTPWDTETIASGASLIRAGTPVRFGVTRASGLPSYLPWFTGTIETTAESTDSNADAWVDLNLVDVAASLAAAGSSNGTDGGGFLTDGFPAAAILTGLLGDAKSPYALDSLVTVDPSPLFNTAPCNVPDATANRLQAAQQLCDSVNVTFYGTPGGLFGLVDKSLRDATILPESYALPALFSNNPDSLSVPIAVDAVTPYASTDRLLNSATGTRSVDGALPQTVTDAESVAQFDIQANALGWPRSDLLLQNDVDVLTLLSQVVDAQAGDFLGVSAIDVDADIRPAVLFPVLAVIAAFGMQGLTFTLEWTHPSGEVFTIDLYVIGFSFGLTMEGEQAKLTGTLRTAKA